MGAVQALDVLRVSLQSKKVLTHARLLGEETEEGLRRPFCDARQRESIIV